MHKISVLFLIWVFLCCGEKSAGQYAVIAGGGSFKTGEGSVSYTLGQVVDGSITYAGYSIYEGVQQPFEIFLISSTKQTDIQFTLSPNPALDFVVLKTDKLLENMKVRLFSADGKEIFYKNIEEEETIISLQSLTGSVYFLAVYTDAYQVQSYTIIKQ